MPVDLLVPRYKVIADYPNMHTAIKIGDIVPISGTWKDVDYLYIQGGYSLKLSRYPHLFKRLEWWEERKEEDMPDYVKYNDTHEIIKVSDLKPPFAFWMFLPATKEEYEKQMYKYIIK